MNKETGYNYMNVSDLILWNSQNFVYTYKKMKENMLPRHQNVVEYKE